MKNIVFVSAMESHPWGGSEELWHGTALRLTQMGHNVFVSVRSWNHPEHERKVLELRRAGATVQQRFPESPERIVRRIWRKICPQKNRQVDLAKSYISKANADLVCISNGNYSDGLWAMELASSLQIPYVPVIQANAEFLWPDDSARERLESAYTNAKAFYCVSYANLALLKSQLASNLTNGAVVRNPFNVPYENAFDWPESCGNLNLACVARLEPDAKGQDLLFHALASNELKKLPIHLSLFGKGRSELGLRKLAKLLNVDDRVSFCGQVNNIRHVWSRHHALVLPSRYEGLPLAIVEAMLCSRPVITTDVSGNAELLNEGETAFISAAPRVAQLTEAIHRAWTCRKNLKTMGHAAREAVKSVIPPDPCQTFADQLLLLTGSPHEHVKI